MSKLKFLLIFAVVFFCANLFVLPIAKAEETKPDLTVKSISENTADNSINITIKNIGTVDADITNSAVKVTYSSDNGNYTGLINAGWLGKKTLVADEEYSILFNKANYLLSTINFVPGLTYKIIAYADYGDGIAESNENNNSLEKTVIVSGASKPDLTVTSIKFESPNNLKGEDGTLSVAVKNLGSDLSGGTAGLLSWYNNFSAQNFVFGSSTPSILSFKTDRDVLTASKPLNTNESVTFSWLGNFNTSGNLYLHFTVDNGNELDESNEKNNTLSTVIQIKENSQDKTETIKDEQVVEIDYTAKLLNKDEFSTILAELKELRNIVKEQAAKIKYLDKLAKNMEKLSAKMESAINNFITYGVDENTQKLGEGERAAVMYSYKSAFDKLPETEAELADAIKIANGRWPSITNDEAEKKAKEQFQKIYQRIADMNDPKDNAAVTVMAYGLRQRAENRNLESEKNGIKIFKNIYGRTPSSTEDWNIMQAITYSGATRGVDSDGDLLTDEREAELGTDPKNKDTDGDGYLDGIEVANGYDPLNK